MSLSSPETTVWLFEKMLLDPIFILKRMNLTHFGSCFETIHDISPSQLEVITSPTLLVEKPKLRESFQDTIQSELNSFTGKICL